ncbi:hypothetical protein QUF74_12695 [Candidatus Halobeggiatoa sp. HSG11]|nr:hypothetical protein [Candidatus Halobeggiatoa sp. HSG11]
MKYRTIKMSNGKKYSGLISDFNDRGEHIEYQKNFFTVEKIGKKSIVYESIISVSTIAAYLIIAIMFLFLFGMIGYKYNNPEAIETFKYKIESNCDDAKLQLADEQKIRGFVGQKHKDSYKESCPKIVEKF